jgi:hypothetical protein
MRHQSRGLDEALLQSAQKRDARSATVWRMPMAETVVLE